MSLSRQNSDYRDVAAGSAPSPDATSPCLGLTQYGQPQVMYGKEVPGDWTIAQSDINQGQLGDCFMLTPLMEIIRQGQLLNHPTFISNMITQNADGSETVKLYSHVFKGTSPIFTPVSEHVTNTFDPRSVNSGYSQDIIAGGGAKEIWPQVLEKAYAQLAGGYKAIADDGFDEDAMMAFTGKPATIMSPCVQTFASLITLTNAHDLITFDTPSQPDDYNTALPGHLVGDHSYAFEGFAGTTAIKVGNPWGPAYGPNTTIPIAQLGTAFDAMTVGHIV